MLGGTGELATGNRLILDDYMAADAASSFFL